MCTNVSSGLPLPSSSPAACWRSGEQVADLYATVIGVRLDKNLHDPDWHVSPRRVSPVKDQTAPVLAGPENPRYQAVPKSKDRWEYDSNVQHRTSDKARFIIWKSDEQNRTNQVLLLWLAWFGLVFLELVGRPGRTRLPVISA